MTRPRSTARACAPGFCLVLALALAPCFAGAQQAGTRTVVAGEQYRAGGLVRLLAGSTYRDLWTAPVTVPVLDLGTFAGGLTPTEKGGGHQTVSLRFRDAGGRTWAFRSVDKFPGAGLHPDLRNTVVHWAVRDQVSSIVPAGGIAAHALEEAAGIPHLTERMYVMPDDPRLGEFRQQFAGMLGTMEERPTAGNTSYPGIAGASRIEDTEDFLAMLDSAGGGERVDVRGYLAVRLVDLLINDWDRHGDQYLWARFDAPGGGVWHPVPRDRDYTFADYDGLAVTFARGFVENLVRFGDRIGLSGLLKNSAPVDRRFLAAIDRAAWDSVTRAVHARLTDAAIDAAIAELAPEYQALRGEQFRRTLRARRDDLPRASADLYRILNLEAALHGTGQADAAEIERLPTGNVRVTLTPAGGGALIAQREFIWTETREVRVFLRGGDDRARVFGSGPEQVIVRVIGGDGNDQMRDEGRSGRHTAFYDAEGTNTFVRRSGTKVDERPWTDVHWEPGAGTLPPRDWGYSANAFAVGGGWGGGGVGPYLSVGPTWTRYGFRRSPYAAKQSMQFQYAPVESRFGAEYQGSFRYVGSPMNRMEVVARVTGLEGTRFYGFGNDTDDGNLSGTHFRVFERQLLGDAEYWHGIAPRTWLIGGVTGRVTAPEPEAGAPAGDLDPRGADDFAVLGGRVGFVMERGDDSVMYVRNGLRLHALGRGFPVAVNDAETFGSAQAVALGYLSAGRRGPTLALRAGGERVWGSFPFQYAAFLGGRGTLRGYASERFAGDAAAYGSAELRQVITRAKLLVRGDLGAFGLADAGRVWYEGESAGDWHTAFGGGLFFTFMDGRQAVSASYAHGEKGRFYFLLGMPF
ncbi:MAG TPA: hypothetical protein VFS20_21675 [Longimicrobium sp.]|nr:hypothetical protein [Longimicrobium sp.]